MRFSCLFCCNVTLQCGYQLFPCFLLLKSILSLKKRYDQFCRWGQIWPLTYLVLWNLSAKDSLNSYIIPKNMEIFILFEYMCSFFFFFLISFLYSMIKTIVLLGHFFASNINQTHSYPLLRNAVGYGKTGLAS